MTTAEFFPYPVYANDLELNLTVNPADAPEAAVPRSSDESFELFRMTADEFVLQATLQIPEDIATLVLPVEERRSPQWQVYLSWESVESRIRGAALMTETNRTYRHRMEIDRREWAGTLSVRACLVRSSRRLHLADRFAGEVGSLLAKSGSTRILFDEPRMPPGAYVQIEWREFSRGEPWLNRQSSNLLALDTRGEFPKLLLNSEIEFAARILDSKATSGRIAAARKSLFASVVHQVWSALLADAIRALSEAKDDAAYEESDVRTLVPDWRGDVLNQWDSLLFPESADQADAERLLKAGVCSTMDIAEILTVRIPEAIQRRGDLVAAVEALGRDLRRDGGEFA